MTDAATYPAGHPSWIDLMTPTPARTHAFYAALFGWTYEIRPDYGGYAMAHQQGRTAAGIMPMEPDSPMPSAWTVYFDSADIAADAERVTELGGQVMVPPMQVGDQGQMGVFSDPTGAVFGLWQAGNHKGAQATDGEGSLAWVQVNTPDSARASAFYQALFHADGVQVPDMDYRQLQHGGLGYAGVSGMAQEGVPAHWIAYFYASDVDAAVQRAVQNGGTLQGEVLDTPFGRMALLADPAGASFWVMNPQRSAHA
ncbi:VOC family protein [Deinococcus ruber]|uniref:Glyoxalase/bleomycin resistance protein n=1 Tax=Deinococcus ruber TaxID=1848197 RepID=A0A918C0V6_9DEIO|nr:VOC family protein [Deinococcus ruber]GGR01175.1 putative glyoxalase/bleomycin resistance protein [Deinococcus ruber]